MRQFFKKKSTTVSVGDLIAIILMSFIYNSMFSKFDFNDVSKVNDFSVRYYMCIQTLNTGSAWTVMVGPLR